MWGPGVGEWVLCFLKFRIISGCLLSEHKPHSSLGRETWDPEFLHLAHPCHCQLPLSAPSPGHSRPHPGATLWVAVGQPLSHPLDLSTSPENWFTSPHMHPHITGQVIVPSSGMLSVVLESGQRKPFPRDKGTVGPGCQYCSLPSSMEWGQSPRDTQERMW